MSHQHSTTPRPIASPISVRKRLRPAFTVIELLVVMAVVMVSLSVALPSLVSSRQSSRNTKCMNNLKQIGLALHNYHDVYNGFSPGWIARGKSPEGKFTNGWQVGILPYIDQGPLYNQLDTVNFNLLYAQGGRNLKMEKLLKTSLAAFKCPAEPDAETNVLRGGWGISNYSGNYGSHPIPRWSDLEFIPGQVPATSPTSRQLLNGIFSSNSITRIRDITDGTSNTFMVGERSVIGRSGLWTGVRSNYHESDAVSDGSWASGLKMSDTGFSSRHSLGLHFGLCDGSVRFVGENLASSQQGSLLQHLCGRNDGNVIGEF